MKSRYTSAPIPLKELFKWQLSKLVHKENIPFTPLTVLSQNDLPQGEYALWLGHASLWLGIGGKTVAIDPVLGDIPFYPRHTPLPIPSKQLYADIVLITHAHYDHYDAPSLITLLRNNPETILVVPSGFWRYVKGKIPRERCFELEWWESVMIDGLFITLVPAKHWSKRTPFDTNKALWGGFVLQNQEHTLYHSGDSAMGEHFREIGEKFDIDEAFLPIGAYRPEVIMKPNHINPPEALHAAEMLGAKTLIPIHYGTFKLSDEPMDEPLAWYEKRAASSEHPFQSRILRIGEIYRFASTSDRNSSTPET
ncbi:MAG: MBL fold metallo-hydrolase [Sulfuricurvum sp.]|nr:MBL fold metallo-hydrolase [Sulfuricurvum sp.]